MATLEDLYGNLFGKSAIQDGDVISMAEHGRVGGLSTGQGYKYVVNVDPNTGLPATVSLNTSGMSLSVTSSVDFSSMPSITGRVLADQGAAGTIPWLITLATLSVVTQPGAGALATVTSQQGAAGLSPWLVTMGTLSVVGGSSSALATVTAIQGDAGSQAWPVTLATLPVIANINNSFIPVTQSGAWSAGVSVSNAISIQSLPTLSTYQGGTWTVQPGNTPNTTAWLVTMGTLPVSASFSGSIPVAGGSLTSYQGSAPWSVLATVSNALTIQSLPTLSVLQGTSPWNSANAGGSLTAYQGSAPWTVMATISNNINTLNAGGSLTAFQGASPWGVKELRSATGTQSIVADTNVDTTVLASNANRLGATVYNDSSALLYLLLANTTSSATVYTVRVYPNGYYEVPAFYTGVLKGIWASDPGDGAARVTEFT